MDTTSNSNTRIPESGTNTNTWKAGFIQVPNNILKARNLDSDSKVVLALLLGTYTYARDNNQLEHDGSFYFTNARFDEQLSISGDQVQRKVIPDLLDKGLIRTIKRLHDGKAHNYYILDFNAINKYDGNRVNPDVEAKKTARAQKANGGRRKKEAIIMQDYGAEVLNLVQLPLSIADREQMFEDIATEIAKKTKYTIQSCKTIVNRMLKQYKEAQADPTAKPEWLKWQEELASLEPGEPLY